MAEKIQHTTTLLDKANELKKCIFQIFDLVFGFILSNSRSFYCKNLFYFIEFKLKIIFFFKVIDLLF